MKEFKICFRGDAQETGPVLNVSMYQVKPTDAVML
jgi:hypothetical protein